MALREWIEVRSEDRMKGTPQEPQQLAAAYIAGKAFARWTPRPQLGKVMWLWLEEEQHLFSYHARPADAIYHLLSHLGAGPVPTMLRAVIEAPWEESLSPEPSLELYKAELAKLREDQRTEEALRREQQRAATAYVEEAIALANPIALRLLGWLYYDGELPLQNVLNAFGDSPEAFECTSRLHFLGALRFDSGRLSITSLGERILREFDLLEDDTTE